MTPGIYYFVSLLMRAKEKHCKTLNSLRNIVSHPPKSTLRANSCPSDRVAELETTDVVHQRTVIGVKLYGGQ